MQVRIFLNVISDGLQGLRMTFFSSRKDKYGYLSKTSSLRTPIWGAKQNVYIYENCGINSGAKFVCQSGKFIMKRNCSVGPGLTVITCNHKYNKVGQRPEIDSWGELEANDVIVNEDVWIGANVTLCPGTIIGRGSIVAAGSVCVQGKEYPPYSIIGGNPATFIKFRLTLEDQIKQESLFYKTTEKIEIQLLTQNYIKFKKERD